MRTPAPIQYSLLDVARAFMVAAHCGVGQVRKYTGEDYYHHPEDVLQILLSYDEPTLEMQVASLLHDVVEDTAVTLVQIQRIFGMDIAGMVSDLTDVSKSSDGNRATRKKIDLDHIADASQKSKRIKCADLISNSGSILKNDIKFAKVYLKEKLNLLKVMERDIGNSAIWQKAMSDCVKYINHCWPDWKDKVKIFTDAGFDYIIDVEVTEK